MKTITFIYEHTDGVRKSLDHVCVPFARANMRIMYAAGYRLTYIKHTNPDLVNEMRELWDIISGGAAYENV